ncbi:hypothetical protein K6119_14680 [Paracrocinitomix mangrovi]|uniref:alpha/beta hydrolase-fold protein n=1 Tax=Paracrocinitomix mangrovi TaxID=2862509 RepID=UPI001C8DBCC3|nr:alpha/beta hydrolase-fold protein [Paracrocinitomix mangrovi]UKN00978.1 hypothetical protein K6119_14680 [Paracrocinitomix mangrovi]
MHKIFFLITISITVTLTAFNQNLTSYHKIKDTSFYSNKLGYNKDISITVPFEWQDDVNKDFPVIVIFDKQNQRSHQYIINTIDYLTVNDQMPSSIIVSIASDQEHRYIETLHKETSEKGKAHLNEAFLFEELFPFVESKYKAGKFRTFIGHSRYGYFTTSLLFSRLNEINAVVSLSPFFTQKNVNLTDSISTLNDKKTTSNIYYRFGIGGDYPDQYELMDSALKKLQNPNINASGVLFKEASHNATPGLTISSALYDIFEYWNNQQNQFFFPAPRDLDLIEEGSQKIINHYGYDFPYTIGILNGAGWHFYNEKEYEKAIKAWEILMKVYPNFSEGYLYIIYAEKELGRDSKTTIDLFKKSMTLTKIYSKPDYYELENEFNELIKK